MRNIGMKRKDRQKRVSIYQRYPEVWRNFSKYLYDLSKYTFVGIGIAGVVQEGQVGNQVRIGFTISAVIAIIALMIETWTYKGENIHEYQ